MDIDTHFEEDFKAAKEKGADAVKRYIETLQHDLKNAEEKYNELTDEAKSTSKSWYTQFRDKLSELRAQAEDHYETVKDKVTPDGNVGDAIKDAATYPWRVINDQVDVKHYQDEWEKVKEQGADAVKAFNDRIKAELAKAEQKWNSLTGEPKKTSKSYYEQFKDKVGDIGRQAESYYETIKDKVTPEPSRRSFGEWVKDTLTYPFRAINDQMDISSYESDFEKAKREGVHAVKSFIDRLKGDLDKAETKYSSMADDVKASSKSYYEQGKKKLSDLKKTAEDYYESAKDKVTTEESLTDTIKDALWYPWRLVKDQLDMSSYESDWEKAKSSCQEAVQNYISRLDKELARADSKWNDLGDEAKKSSKKTYQQFESKLKDLKSTASDLKGKLAQ